MFAVILSHNFVIYNLVFIAGVPRTLTVTNLGTGMINISWTIPTGIYPLEVFPSGLSYQITYRTLRNLGNVQTLTTTNTQLQVLLVSGEFYIIRVAAAILDANFGPVAITTLALGNEISNWILDKRTVDSL